MVFNLGMSTNERLTRIAAEIIDYRGERGHLLDAGDARWYAAEETSLNENEQDEVARIICQIKGW